MSHNVFGVDTSAPHPPAQTPPPFHAPPPDPREQRRTRGWTALIAAAVVGAAISAAAAAIIVVQASDTGGATALGESAPVTVTVAAPRSAKKSPPPPLPAAQADRQTCQGGWIAAGNLSKSAVAALDVLPPGLTIADPVIRTNPAWDDAVRTAGDLYHRASQALRSQIAPGTTPILANASDTAAQSLNMLGETLIGDRDLNGNASAIADAAAEQMAVLCTRLAP